MIYKLKATCEDCRDPIIDFGDCPCSPDCVECQRYVGCVCTCKEMHWTSCTVFESVECSCLDGTTATHDRIVGLRIGGVASNLQEIAALWCPGNPTTEWRLYGSRYDFVTHQTTSNIKCPVSSDGYDLLEVEGEEVHIDVSPVDLVSCTDGTFFLSAEELGIETIPTPGGTATDCTQEGGRELLFWEVKDGCGNLLVLCPFAGVLGEKFTCTYPENHCCDWALEIVGTQCTDGLTTVSITATKIACDCEVTESVSINSGTAYTLTGTADFYEETVPCISGQLIVITISKTFAEGCLPDCTQFNGSENTSILV